MVQLRGPLFSEKAQKQLGHNLIYKRKGPKSLLTKYNKPGGVAPFDPSPNQINKRMIYNLIIANWQVKNAAQKKVFDDLAKSKNLKMSGWNYFLLQSFGDLPTYLGLQGYWAFNRIVAGKYQDISGNANHGTPKPLYPSNYPQMVDSINRKFGKAASFDAIDDYVDCGDGESLNMGVGDVTMEVWIKAAALVGTKTIFVKRAAPSPSAGYWFSTVGDGTIWVQITDGVNPYVLTGTTDLHDNNWHHVAVVFDRDNPNGCKIYVDGEDDTAARVGVLANVGDIDNTGIFKIGESFEAAWRRYNGFLDEVRIYNRVLLGGEIEKHFNLVS